MEIPNPEIDAYLADGCGRCEFYQTERCKVNDWRNELVELRRIALECGLREECKWGCPCYTYNDSNVLMISALRNCAVLAFFKGVLLRDTEGLLLSPGKSSQSDRQFRFTDVKRIAEMERTIKAYIFEAIELEKAGAEVTFKKEMEPLPEELLACFATDAEFQQAFESLTPGRQRGYILHFSQAKKSETRMRRIEKYRQQVMDGIGLHDHYKSGR